MNESKSDLESNVKAGKPATPTVDWDDSQMSSSYANVVNASSTREEFNLFFGTNQTWKNEEHREFHVKLNNRIVLSPFAAKRLHILLGATLSEYESRFGSLGMDAHTMSKAPQASASGSGNNA